jgi:hypothetical protein
MKNVAGTVLAIPRAVKADNETLLSGHDAGWAASNYIERGKQSSRDRA